MKKFVACLLTLCMTVATIGCGGGDADKKDEKKPAPAGDDDAKTPPDTPPT